MSLNIILYLSSFAKKFTYIFRKDRTSPRVNGKSKIDEHLENIDNLVQSIIKTANENHQCLEDVFKQIEDFEGNNSYPRR